MNDANCKSRPVWDLPTRLFHWINFLTVFTLVLLGMLMLFRKDLGIESVEAKIALKEIHVVVGYLFVLNLLWRLAWGFMGNHYARWRNILPGKGFGTELQAYLASVREGRPLAYAGHNPMGRLAVSFILLLLLALSVTGLVRAGTDIHYPPFGSLVTGYLAAPGVDPASLQPYDKSGVDPEKAASLKAFKGPFGEVHKLSAYVLMGMILLHILFVVRADIMEGNGLISAMFTGRKLFRRPAVDWQEGED